VRRVRRIIAIGVCLIVVALVTDRLALFVWRSRVLSFFHALQAASAKHVNWIEPVRENPLLSWSTRGNLWPVPLLEVSLRGPVPDTVTVDGNGGLNLFYTPPLLAWSRHVPWAYARRPNSGSDEFPYNDVYMIKIRTIEGNPPGRVLALPNVILDHGLPY
jgi:hypothetical protein